MNTLEELKTNKTDTIPPDLESKIRGDLAELRTITPYLDRKIWNNLAQISSEIAAAPTTVTRPTPAPKPTRPPSVPVEESEMGVGGAILGGVLIAGGVAALAVALAGSAKKTTSTGEAAAATLVLVTPILTAAVVVVEPESQRVSGLTHVPARVVPGRVDLHIRGTNIATASPRFSTRTI
ncbi:MAG: hypothetical protein HY096_05160 [Nitrospinae bacterium]|nr:hypothetical protein [Nitrospinota bacterium]